MLFLRGFLGLRTISQRSFVLESKTRILSSYQRSFERGFAMDAKKPSNLSAKVQVSILGNGASGNPASVIVNTDTDTFLINCGEGVQRLFYQHKIRISKIKDVFLTRVAHHNYAGLFGVFLTYDSYFSDRGSTPTLYTPSAMKTMASYYQPFIGLVKNFEYRFLGEDAEGQRSLECQTIFSNIDMTIKSLPLECAQPDDLAIAYIFLITDKPGPLMIEKCKQLKIPPGPLFAKLKSGQNIEVNGTTVKPTDVLGPTEVGGAFVVLECPDDRALKSLVENCGNFHPHLDGRKLQFVVHITSKHLFRSQAYQSWIDDYFDSTVKHLVLNSSNSSEMSLIDSSRVQVLLNEVDSHVFPILNENQPATFEPESSDNKNCYISENSPTMLTMTLRPAKMDTIQTLAENYQIDIDNVTKDLRKNEQFQKSVECYKSQIATIQKCSNSNFSPSILFLGTGSSIPGKLRNTSAILLKLNDDSSALFDCGEATFMQLSRFYGRDQAMSNLDKIKLIFISHLHADHHFGMVRILTEMSKNIPDDRRRTMIIVAPYVIDDFLKNFTFPRLDIVFVNCPDVLYGKEDAVDVAKLQNNLGFRNISTVVVPHSYQSFGIVMELEDGRKIAYSGDSEFSTSFDQAAADCFLMIHEATMDDELREEATAKHHSTISDAIRVGRNCRAKYTILTHFSQRYAKIPIITAQEDAELTAYIENNLGIAFDFMNINLDEIEKIGPMKRPLELLFANALTDIQDKQAKKAMKRKLIEEESAKLASN